MCFSVKMASWHESVRTFVWPHMAAACCAIAHARQPSKSAVGMMKLLAFLRIKKADGRPCASAA